MQIDVPAYVSYDTHVQNSVQVKGGTNWDLSRGALPTPIATLPDPEPKRPSPSADCDCNLAKKVGSTAYLPQHHIPEHAPNVTVRFARGAVLLSGGSQAELKKLPRQGVVVAGHADPTEKAPVALAKKRAEAVARTLRKNGIPVEAVKSFGADLPIVGGEKRPDTNRRVEVFTR